MKKQRTIRAIARIALRIERAVTSEDVRYEEPQRAGDSGKEIKIDESYADI